MLLEKQDQDGGNHRGRCQSGRHSGPGQGFAEDLSNHVLPYIMGKDPDDIIGRASITKDGKLTKEYSYLSEYASGA